MGKEDVTFKVKVLVGGFLALIAGYTDSVSIIQHHAYASMMTGNMIQFSRFAVSPGGWAQPQHGNLMLPSAAFVLVLILCNMLGVMVFNIAEYLNKYGTTIISPIGAILIGLMEVAAYMDWGISTRLQLYPLTFIFGIQNAMSMVGVVGAPTTLCTGHLGNLAGALQKLLVGKKGDALNKKNGLSLAIVLFFLVGSIIGVFAVDFAKGTAFDHFLLLPATVALAVLMVIDDLLCTEPDNKKAPDATALIPTGSAPP